MVRLAGVLAVGGC